MKDLYFVKLYSFKANAFARFLVGHSSQDLAEDWAKGEAGAGYEIESVELICPLMAETQLFCKEV